MSRIAAAVLLVLELLARPAAAVEPGDPAPELAGIEAWLNSEPLTVAGLRGKVVLVNFWTLACGNCIATLPHVKVWHERFAARGLVVVGVHTGPRSTSSIGAAWCGTCSSGSTTARRARTGSRSC